MAFYDLRRDNLASIASCVRTGDDRNIIICNYELGSSLASNDFYEIEKNIGCIRYLGIWVAEECEAKEEEMKLEAPPKEEKPKPAEGEEEAPPPEEEG